MRRALLVLGLACGGCGEDVVTIRDGNRVVLEVTVTRAETAAERMNGLRGRTLAAGEGLVLAFPVEDEVCIANGGVALPIDAVFVGADARVTAVERAIAAGDGTARCAIARDVLEIRSGEASAVAVGFTADGL